MIIVITIVITIIITIIIIIIIIIIIYMMLDAASSNTIAGWERGGIRIRAERAPQTGQIRLRLVKLVKLVKWVKTGQIRRVKLAVEGAVRSGENSSRPRSGHVAQGWAKLAGRDARGGHASGYYDHERL